MYTNAEIQLAHEIAERLDDSHSVPYYLKCAHQCPHKMLRQKLDYVCSLPERKITTSRAAYFVFLVETEMKNKTNLNADFDDDSWD